MLRDHGRPESAVADDDERVRARRLELFATWTAEPTILRMWAADSGDPGLVEAYQALAGRVEKRLGEVAARLRDRLGPAATGLGIESARIASDAASVRHELSRLKWLRTARQSRLDAAPTLAGLIDVPAETRDRDELDARLQALARRLC